MKFVALLSGGKDSCYNIEKCLFHGHILECVANLHPPLHEDVDEVNSYMYQSAAYNTIPFLAECLDVPLIRRPLTGSAILQTLDYEMTTADEVEDLYELLKEVKIKYPDVEGVSCGTIVSSYQRYRVENVCIRLGLVPLTYLWQRERSGLLKEMIAANVHAVLVKVAGAGLDPDKHLGKSIATMEPTLHRLHERFQLDVCGEGGEYESLVLDCTCFKRKLSILESSVVYDEEDPSVGSLKIISCAVVDKERITSKEDSDSHLGDHCEELSTNHEILPPLDSQPGLVPKSGFPLVFDCEGYCQSPLLISPTSPALNSAEAQLSHLFHSLSLNLKRYNVDLCDVVFAHLYISDMELFDSINVEYCKWFGANPPSRACVAVPLPGGIHVAMSVCVLAGSFEDMKQRDSSSMTRREVMHVRSLSEWAPLCIGPYAQANVLNKSLSLIAGQIGLHPATMRMIGEVDFRQRPHIPVQPAVQSSCINQAVYLELYQSLLNTNRVLTALDSDGGGIGSAVLCIIYTSLSNDNDPTSQYFNEMLESCSRQIMVDIVLRCHSSQVNEDPEDMSETSSKSSDDGGDSSKRKRDNFVANIGVLPIAVVGVKALPRGALVEVECIAATALMQTCGVSYQHQLQREESTEKAVTAQQIVSRHTSPLEDMRTMPMWTESYKPSLLRVAEYSEAWKCDVWADIHMAKCDTALSCGFIRMNEAKNSSYEFLDLAKISKVLCKALEKVAGASLMEKHDLRTLKIFYDPQYLGGSDIASAVTVALGSILGICHIIPHIIPVENLTNPTTILVTQFTFVNFIQIKTELWIRNR